jgi:hypothetical protein
MTGKAEVHRIRWIPVLIDTLLVGALTIAVAAVLIWQPSFIGQVRLQSGDVAQRDIVAPRYITYESTILTQKARERAAQAIPDYYDPPQSRIRRQQVSRSREILEYITTVRSDTFARMEDKLDYILAITDVRINPALARQILELTPEEWQSVVQEVPVVLDQIMRDEIRETSMPAVFRRVPALVNPELNDDSNRVASELVKLLIRPNSFLNVERTQELREQAQLAVPVQMNTLEKGEIILRAGDIATPEDIEALEQMGLQMSEWTWRSVAQALLLSMVFLSVFGSILYRLRPRTFFERKELSLFLLLFLSGLVVAKLMIIPHNWLPLLFPLAALAMLAATLLDLQAAIVLILGFTLIVAHFSNGDVNLILYNSLGALVGSVILGKADRVTAFIWAGIAIGLSNLAVTLIFWIPMLDIWKTQFTQSIVAILVNGGLSASVALIGYLLLGNLFRITTSLQLMELSRPTHPLLRQLLLNAPGTYHHTILVSNLAERGAEAIGADAFLTRVGAYYHDIGKTARPYFFSENIADGVSPHENLDPQTSAQIIISHVADGVDLARKYGLPAPIQDFIREHHGTQLVKYFYYQAQQLTDGTEEVVEAEFRYPGPDPKSKETAILMLADVCEAAVRAERPGSRQELDALLDKLITERVLDGSLEQSDLTLGELSKIKQVFSQVLQGVHHPRIRYPRPPIENQMPPTGTTGKAVFAPATPANEAVEPLGENSSPQTQVDSPVLQPSKIQYPGQDPVWD